MVEGKMYCVRYRLDNQKLEREMTATFLGKNQYGDFAEFLFNLRPLAGTISLDRRSIISIRDADGEKKCIEKIIRTTVSV